MGDRKRALITGITGQDGSYLSELLLEKGYEVHGIIRRTSTFNTDRIDHIYVDPHQEGAALRLHYGDLTDGGTLRRIIELSQPDEIYNLGAQSHVRVSFDAPQYTVETVAMGTLRLLEAIREYQERTGKRVKFYQAGSSEMFGLVQEVPQRETTPFYPRSPYACAKVYAHWQTVNYREAYHLFACNGILFNHECVTGTTPVILRRQGLIDILPIAEVVPHCSDPKQGKRYTTELAPADRFEVWDAQGWTTVTCMTATWNGGDKTVHRIMARAALYETTADHQVFVLNGETPCAKETRQVQVGDRLALIDLPPATEQVDVSPSEAWLLGILVAKGHITPEGKVTVANHDPELLARVGATWRKVAAGYIRESTAGSGFPSGQPVSQLHLEGNCDYGRYLYPQIYTREGYKRIPQRILNADHTARLAFLEGFNAGDGLRSPPWTDGFQGFCTASPVLAAGLYWLVSTTLEQPITLCLEEGGDRTYYKLTWDSSQTRQSGQHLCQPKNEVITAHAIAHEGWVFDLATTSGTFHAGIGQGWIHNSPRRGETFVTRKITRAVARIVAGQQNKLYLGNLDAKRDWGYAKDYVRAMWLMLQQEQPDDYVIATGETHSVREFLELAFGYVGLNWQDYVEFDPRYLRPTEVDLLLGDPTKAKTVLGWQPSVTFPELVALMVEADLRAVGIQGTTPKAPSDTVLDLIARRQLISKAD